MGKRKTVALGLLCIIAATFASSYILLSQDSVEERTTAKIAAFNIQIFGRTKRQKEEVMTVLTKIAREFDIVLCLNAMRALKSKKQIEPLNLRSRKSMEARKSFPHFFYV